MDDNVLSHPPKYNDVNNIIWHDHYELMSRVIPTSSTQYAIVVNGQRRKATISSCIIHCIYNTSLRYVKLFWLLVLLKHMYSNGVWLCVKPNTHQKDIISKEIGVYAQKLLIVSNSTGIQHKWSWGGGGNLCDHLMGKMFFTLIVEVCSH